MKGTHYTSAATDPSGYWALLMPGSAVEGLLKLLWLSLVGYTYVSIFFCASVPTQCTFTSMVKAHAQTTISDGVLALFSIEAEPQY